MFCAIAAGEAARSVVHQDELVVVFMDRYPVNPGHLLVVPMHHATSLADLPPATGTRMMEVAMRLARALQASPLRADGINLFLADGAAAGQEIFHIHLHVIPRFSGDGFSLRIDYDRAPNRAALDQHAALVAAALAGAGS